MVKYRQGNPYCVQIEPSEGCNLRCSFCGINGIRTTKKTYKFMSPDTATHIATGMQSLGWNSRLEFAMHGEPLMNPDILTIIKIFRNHLPKAYMLMETNGGPLVKNTADKISELFDTGLSTLAIDEYQDIDFAEDIFNTMDIKHGEEFFTPGTNRVEFWNYPDAKEGNPHQRNKKKRLVRVRPIDIATNGTHASLNNHGGAGGPPNSKARGKRCAKPFRELSFRWDGKVAVCCNDWRGELPIGDINVDDLDTIWHHPVMYAARRKLYAGERDFGACDGCDALSYRPGILPDHLGKEELDLPSIDDELLIDEALQLGPLTAPVARPWEK